MPYTYLLGWSEHNKYYYGVRFAKNCTPDDLWREYKTSSKHVKKFAEIYGDPDIIQVRKIFKEVGDAREWESRVLRKMHVVSDSRFLNKTDNKSIDSMAAGHGKAKGRRHAEETKEKIRQKNIGKALSSETKQKISATFQSKCESEKKRIQELKSTKLRGRVAWNKGLKYSLLNANNKGVNNSMFGKQHSDEAKDKMSKAKQGRVWINRNKSIKYISEELVSEFLSSGWNIGRGTRKQ